MLPAVASSADALRGRRVLVISPRYFGYEKRIVAHLESRGARTEWLDERPGNSTVCKALTRISPATTRPLAHAHYARALDRLKSAAFDDILFVNVESSTPAIVRKFQSQFPSARLLLYMWDSFENKPRGDTRAFIALFDRALTFDPVDADRYAMTFRPLFYSDDSPASPEQRHEFAFSFVGTIHSDRYRVLGALASRAREAGLAHFIYPYLQSTLVYWRFRATKPEFRGTRPADFRFTPMPYADVMAVMRSSQAIVDVEHPRQRGLTMRTLEVLGSGKKLLTTNAHVRRYPFYSEDRILVLDRERLELDRAFFERPAPPLPRAFAAEYSLRGWADAVFA